MTHVVQAAVFGLRTPNDVAIYQMASSYAFVLLASLACAIDALVLGVLYRSAGDRPVRERFDQAFVLAGSHAAFALLGYYAFRLSSEQPGWLPDAVWIGTAVALVMVGGWIGRSRGQSLRPSDWKLPTLLSGVDAAVLGGVAVVLDVSAVFVLISSAATAMLAFLLPLVLLPWLTRKGSQALYEG